MDRTVLHCDMNGFFASVELLSLPQLLGKPVAVCGDPGSRHGIILAKSEEAKAYGIVTAETVWQAKRKCPQLILIPAHHDRYKYYCEKINEIYRRFTDLVEPFSIDESWLDVTGSLNLFGTGKEIGDRIRQTVKSDLGLTLSVGVSFNKVFSKMGSEYKKPDATTVISRENYKELLWPLSVRELFFVGQATGDKLLGMGIRTIGDLARADPKLLTLRLGKQGLLLHEYASGSERSPVRHCAQKQQAKSVGNGLTFKRDLLGEADIKTAVTALADTVASRLRSQKLRCGGVKVDIKDPFFKTISRQKQMDQPSNLGEEITRSVLELMFQNWDMALPIRLLTVTGIQLTEEGGQEQLSLFSESQENRQKQEKMERTMDAIRKKYGGQAITFGGIVKNDMGITLHEEEIEIEQQAEQKI